MVDEKANSKMDVLIEDPSSARRKRKKEGKLRKRQRIEESGGVRPREKTPATDKTSMPKSKKYISPQIPPPKKQTDPDDIFKKSKKSNSNKGRHRFGRVMDVVPCRNKPRFSTLSIAIPGSVVANCQTRELRTQICGQIARAATIYHVDEIVVFDDKLSSKPNHHLGGHYSSRGWYDDDKKDGNEKGEQKDDGGDGHFSKSDPHTFMARILQYCECPQYLRRHFFPINHELKFAGLLPPIDAPHHVRAEVQCPYREGVVLEEKYVTDKEMTGRLVNCGIRGRPVEIGQRLTPGIRCTVHIKPEAYKPSSGRNIKGEVVSPSAPREENGTYWGYTVRLANSIKDVMDNCPYSNSGYDLKIGTSERGDVNIDSSNFASQLAAASSINSKTKKSKTQKNTYRHALIVFGGIAGIEECVDADESLKLPGSESRKLFDLWVNVCPYQGSKTIRTEEAVMITLAKMSAPLANAAADSEDLVAEDGSDDDSSTSSSSGSDDEKEKNKSKTATKVLPPVQFSDDEPSEESSDEEEDNANKKRIGIKTKNDNNLPANKKKETKESSSSESSSSSEDEEEPVTKKSNGEKAAKTQKEVLQRSSEDSSSEDDSEDEEEPLTKKSKGETAVKSQKEVVELSSDDSSSDDDSSDEE